MSEQWREKLAAGRPLLLDGGTGSELQRRGVSVDPVIWNAAAASSHYETLVSVHADFIRAGAEVITVNTFATNRYVLDAAGLGSRFRAITEAAVSAAREAAIAAPHPVAVAGSMSCLPPGFDASRYPDRRVERAAYCELADTLAELGVDVINLEMMQDARHSLMAMRAACDTGLPVWLGISCRIDSDDQLVAFDYPGLPIRDCLLALLPSEPDVVNVMHSPCNAIDRARALLGAEWGGPWGVYPEVGSFDTTTRLRTASTSPEELASHAGRWCRTGALLLGACCGSTPEHIRAIARVIDSAPNPESESAT